MPKGPTPSLIGSTLGKPRRDHVLKKSKCKRCSGTIDAGTDCIGIPQLGGSFQPLRRYCEDCYKQILAKTQTDIEALKAL